MLTNLFLKGENMTEEYLKKLWQELKKIEGATISLGNDNLSFAREAKNNAKKFDLLYHCCSMEALLSIIKHKEFWLSNLTCVNDKEECEKVDVSEYKNSFFVGCFTFDDNVPDEHWKEYGTYDNGVLFSVKQDWFKKSAVFMTMTNQKLEDDYIFTSQQKAMENKIQEQQINNRITHPFFIFDFDFYQVIYDDNLVKNISGECEMTINDKVYKGRSLVPYVAGIIKSTSGLCCRWGSEPYKKDWTTEKEVRLKVGINNTFNNMNSLPIFPKIAVSLNDEAFEEFKIRFSPNVSQNRKDDFITELKTLLPISKIDIL